MAHIIIVGSKIKLVTHVVCARSMGGPSLRKVLVFHTSKTSLHIFLKTSKFACARTSQFVFIKYIYVYLNSLAMKLAYGLLN
jgi:hypothetical protein